MILRRQFVIWFKKYGRIFPWRDKKTTPFAFMVTEMLLRQTRASNVAKIWVSFIKKYPTPESIANANRQDLVMQLETLGFGNQKAEALQQASNWLLEHHEGSVPNSLEKLLKVPHIGLYSARAILCFAFDKKIEIVDTNIQRFFARYYGIDIKADIRRNPVVWRLAKESLPRDKKKVKEHNYGLLDFTADICKSGRPKCEVCPLSLECVFGVQQLNVHPQK